jgi:hypothetical protein
MVHALRVHDVLEVREPSTSAQVLSYKVCLQQIVYDKKCIKVRMLETVNEQVHHETTHTNEVNTNITTSSKNSAYMRSDGKC